MCGRALCARGVVWHPVYISIIDYEAHVSKRSQSALLFTCSLSFLAFRCSGSLGCLLVSLSNKTKLAERFSSLLSKAFKVLLNRVFVLLVVPLRSFCSAVIAPLSLRDCPQDLRFLLWFCPGFLYLLTPPVLVLRLGIFDFDPMYATSNTATHAGSDLR